MVARQQGRLAAGTHPGCEGVLSVLTRSHLKYSCSLVRRNGQISESVRRSTGTRAWSTAGSLASWANMACAQSTELCWACASPAGLLQESDLQL